MITFILKILIAVYLIVMIQQVHSMIQYNSNAVVKTIQIPNKDKINDELKNKHPLLIIYPENKLGYTLDSMNQIKPGYIIQDGKSLLSLDKLSSIKISSYKLYNLSLYSGNIKIISSINDLNNLYILL